MTLLRLIEAGWTEREVRMRLPFQFGSTEVWGAPEAYARVVIEVAGKRHEGRSAQLMVPRWFDKRAELTNADTIEELRTTIRATVTQCPERSGTLLALMRELRQDIAAALPDVPALAAGFGPALIEMAAIDALCTATGAPFWQAARDDLFGLAHGAPEGLAADVITRSLARIGPPVEVALRHTVGFKAPLRTGEVTADAPKDGLPVALDEVITRTGISALKIKLKGDPEADLARLRDIGRVAGSVPGLSVTLDANEQYDPADFADFTTAYADDPALSRLYMATRFVEQPFPREIALATPVRAALPLIIDESDDSEESFTRALSLGWSGTSIKSCKGVLRALLNKARADISGAELSGEDLTCQPGLGWQQDTAMMAACGVRDIERNGHHFAGGMQGATTAERHRFLRAHPDIYTGERDKIALRIVAGTVGIGSMDVPGFGGDTNTLSMIDSDEFITY